MAKPIVFVIGATGSIGAATVLSLSREYAERAEIRAGVRHPEKAAKLKLPGVTLVRAKMGDETGSLVETLRGVDALFIVTPGHEKRVALTISTASAAAAAGVKFVLVVSAIMAEMSDSIFGRQFNEIETEIPKLTVSFAFLRLSYFVENYLAFQSPIKAHSTFYSPQDPARPYTPIVVADAGRAAASILVNPSAHLGKTYKLVSDRHTLGDVEREFSLALERKVKFVRVPYETEKKSMLAVGLPEWQANGVFEMYRLVDSGSPVINVADMGAYKAITGEEPTDLRTWVRQVAAAFKD